MADQDQEDYRARARKRAAQRKTSVWYKLEGTPGGTDNTFRILATPETPKPEDPKDKRAMAEYRRNHTQPVWHEYGVHRDVGPKKVQVRCGKDPLNDDQGECWLCDTKIPALRKSGHVTRADMLAPTNTLALQVAKVDADDDGSNPKFTGPFIFTPSKTVGDQLLASVIGAKKRSYVDPKKGYNITINRIGTGRNDTKYGMIQPDEDPSVVPAELVKKLKPFSELKEIPLYDEAKQKAAYSGVDVVDEEEEEDEPKPKAGKPKRPPVDADEDDDPDVGTGDDEEEDDPDTGDEEEEEEEEPEPVRPKKKKAPPVKDPEEEEEEAEEPEEEEEEEPTPPKKKKKPAPPPEDEEEDDPDLDDLDDEEEEEEPAPPPKKKKKAPPVEEPEEEEEEPEEEEEAEEEEEPAPPPKKKKAVIPPPKKKK